MSLKLKTRLKHKALIDMTSLIDLVFLLVAFFMVTSSLGSESIISVQLPKAVQTGKYRSSSIVVSVNAENKVFVNDVKFDRNGLLEKFREVRKGLKHTASVVIRGDRKADYEVIVEVMDKLNQAGIPKFTLSTVK